MLVHITFRISGAYYDPFEVAAQSNQPSTELHVRSLRGRYPQLHPTSLAKRFFAHRVDLLINSPSPVSRIRRSDQVRIRPFDDLVCRQAPSDCYFDRGIDLLRLSKYVDRLLIINTQILHRPDDGLDRPALPRLPSPDDAACKTLHGDADHRRHHSWRSRSGCLALTPANIRWRCSSADRTHATSRHRQKSARISATTKSISMSAVRRIGCRMAASAPA